jgi:HEAT repeat protein
MDPLRRAIDDLQSSDETRAEAAVATLAPMGSAALAALQSLLVAPSPETRWWAIRATAAVQDDAVPGLLCSGLQDPALEVRQAAALGLRHHPSPESAPILAGLLADRDPLLCRLASDALAAIGESAIAELEDALASPPPSAAYAARALALMNSAAAIPALFGALDHESSIARYWAERGLDDLGVGMVFFQP